MNRVADETSPDTGKPPFMRRARNWMAGLLGIALVSSAPLGLAQTGGIPQPWLSYARLASGQFQAWLSDGSNEAVQRLHAQWQKRLMGAAANSPPPAVIVRVWVAEKGQVSRVVFNTLGDAATDNDLRAILTAQPLSEPPPRDMRQPMVLKLDLDFLE
jgi:hypothetical protein